MRPWGLAVVNQEESWLRMLMGQPLCSSSCDLNWKDISLHSSITTRPGQAPYTCAGAPTCPARLSPRADRSVRDPDVVNGEGGLRAGNANLSTSMRSEQQVLAALAALVVGLSLLASAYERCFTSSRSGSSSVLRG